MEIRIVQKAIIQNEAGKILALRRSATDDHRPLTWDLPGGRVDSGKRLEASIHREIKEETGLMVTDLRFYHLIDLLEKRRTHFIAIAYTAKATSKEITLSYEHDQYQWLTKKEFLALKSSPRIKEFVSKLPNEK